MGARSGPAAGDSQEVAGLSLPGGAEREEVVCAPVKPGGAGTTPVLVESLVDEVPSFGCLDVGEADVVLGDPLPVDGILVGRDIDPVPFAVLERWPPVRHPHEPPDGSGEGEEQDNRCDDKRPSCPAPWRGGKRIRFSFQV